MKVFSLALTQKYVSCRKKILLHKKNWPTLVMDMDMATYASWTLCYNNRRYPSPVSCTIAQVREMCAMFEAAFPGVKCRPEPISNGGVELTDWPGKMGGGRKWHEYGYKTFRFLCTTGYPWIDETTRDDASFVLSAQDGTVTIKLKAFKGAPAFSDAELMAFRRIFEEVVSLPDGWRFKALPSAKTVNNPRNW